MADKEPPMNESTHPRDGRPTRFGGSRILAMRLGVVAAAVSAAVLVSSAQATAGTLTPTPRDTAILATAPAYYYPLATDATDASGNSNPALTTTDVWGHTGGTVTYTGTAAAFNGEAFLNDGPAPATTDFAVGAWFKTPKTFAYARTILSAQGWTLETTQGSLGWVQPYPGTGFTVSISSGVEHQVIASDHAGLLSLYVDGKLVGTHKVGAVTPAALSVGSKPGQADFNALNGTVSNVAGWTHSLSSSQVAGMWSAGRTAIVFHRWSMLRHVGGRS